MLACLERTYEELKRHLLSFFGSRRPRLERTYEELKPFRQNPSSR